MDYIHFETEADIRRHLGASRGARASAYDRAWDMLEAADARPGNANKIQSCPAEKSWIAADRKARALALAAVEDSSAVRAARKLADQLRDSGATRAYAKAVAARIETERAVWMTAYGRAMPKEWRVKR